MHRDIKPENILFDKEGFVYLSDFGIAKKINKNCLLKAESGTLMYMAPETLFNKGHNHLVDYYAIGIILCEIILRGKPFVSKRKEDVNLFYN